MTALVVLLDMIDCVHVRIKPMRRSVSRRSRSKRGDEEVNTVIPHVLPLVQENPPASRLGFKRPPQRRTSFSLHVYALPSMAGYGPIRNGQSSENRSACKGGRLRLDTEMNVICAVFA